MRLDSRFAGSKLTVRNDCQLGNWTDGKRISLSGECSVSALVPPSGPSFDGIPTAERLFSGYGLPENHSFFTSHVGSPSQGAAQVGLGLLGQMITPNLGTGSNQWEVVGIRTENVQRKNQVRTRMSDETRKPVRPQPTVGRCRAAKYLQCTTNRDQTGNEQQAFSSASRPSSGPRNGRCISLRVAGEFHLGWSRACMTRAAMNATSSIEARLKWLMNHQPNNLSAINALRIRLGIVPLPESNKVMPKLKWLLEHQPNNLVAINALREKLGLNPLPPTVEGKGLRFSPEKNWVSRGRSTN